MNDELLIDKAYVEISTYRTRVLKNCTKEGDMPVVLAKKSGIRPNHISKTLRELKDKNMVVCINEEARKGRLYRLTEKGSIIQNAIRRED